MAAVAKVCGALSASDIPKIKVAAITTMVTAPISQAKEILDLLDTVAVLAQSFFPPGSTLICCVFVARIPMPITHTVLSTPFFHI
jgi:hypothetical protein